MRSSSMRVWLEDERRSAAQHRPCPDRGGDFDAVTEEAGCHALVDAAGRTAEDLRCHGRQGVACAHIDGWNDHCHRSPGQRPPTESSRKPTVRTLQTRSTRILFLPTGPALRRREPPIEIGIGSAIEGKPTMCQRRSERFDRPQRTSRDIDGIVTDQPVVRELILVEEDDLPVPGLGNIEIKIHQPDIGRSYLRRCCDIDIAAVHSGAPIDPASGIPP